MQLGGHRHDAVGPRRHLGVDGDAVLGADQRQLDRLDGQPPVVVGGEDQPGLDRVAVGRRCRGARLLRTVIGNTTPSWATVLTLGRLRISTPLGDQRVDGRLLRAEECLPRPVLLCARPRWPPGPRRRRRPPRPPRRRPAGRRRCAGWLVEAAQAAQLAGGQLAVAGGGGIGVLLDPRRPGAPAAARLSGAGPSQGASTPAYARVAWLALVISRTRPRAVSSAALVASIQVSASSRCWSWTAVSRGSGPGPPPESGGAGS